MNDLNNKYMFSHVAQNNAYNGYNYVQKQPIIEHSQKFNIDSSNYIFTTPRSKYLSFSPQLSSFITGHDKGTTLNVLTFPPHI